MVKINEIKGLFWGVNLVGDKKYTQTAERPVHISMAALDTTRQQVDGCTVSVMIDYNGSSFVLCTLQHGKVFQQPLDLEFAAGETLTFYLTGKGSVHLSGYCLNEDDPGFDYDGDDSSEPESDEEDVSNDSDDEDSSTGKRKLVVKGGKNAKKARMTIDDLDEDDADDSDDDDFVDFEASEDDNDDDDDDDDDDAPQDDFDEESDSDESPKPAAKNAKLGNGPSAKAAVVNVTSKEKTDKSKASTAAASQPQKSEGSSEAEGKKKKKKKKNKKKDAGANQQQDLGTKPDEKKTPVVTSKLPSKRTAEGGVVIEDLKEGHGPEATMGKMVRVYYTGRLSNGKVFDACVSGNGFKFKLGKKEVISGWDVGVAGMKVGGKRKLVIPPKMGYGTQKAGPIPPNSTLVFDVELKAVN